MNLMKRKLEQYRNKYGRIKVAQCYQLKNTKSAWIYMWYPSRQAYYVTESQALTDREILQDEIVIETDKRGRLQNKIISEKQELVLRKYGFSYSRWYSGNKSYHIHIFFPELLSINGYDDLRLIKSLFVRWLYSCNKYYLDYCFHCDGTIQLRKEVTKCNLIEHNVDMQLFAKHLIRLEYGFNMKGNKDKEMISENITDRINTLPLSVWNNFYKLKAKRKRYTVKNSKIVSDMQCMKFLYNNSFDNCRKRIVYIMYSNLRASLGEVKAKQMIHWWNKFVQRNYLSAVYMKGQINYVNKNHKKIPRCTYIIPLLQELKRHDVCHGCKYDLAFKVYNKCDVKI